MWYVLMWLWMYVCVFMYKQLCFFFMNRHLSDASAYYFLKLLSIYIYTYWLQRRKKKQNKSFWYTFVCLFVVVVFMCFVRMVKSFWKVDYDSNKRFIKMNAIFETVFFLFGLPMRVLDHKSVNFTSIIQMEWNWRSNKLESSICCSYSISFF